MKGGLNYRDSWVFFVLQQYVLHTSAKMSAPGASERLHASTGDADVYGRRLYLQRLWSPLDSAGSAGRRTTKQVHAHGYACIVTGTGATFGYTLL